MKVQGSPSYCKNFIINRPRGPKGRGVAPIGATRAVYLYFSPLLNTMSIIVIMAKRVTMAIMATMTTMVTMVTMFALVTMITMGIME